VTRSAAYAYLALALLVAGLFLSVLTLGRNRPADSPRLGLRGKKRAEARAAEGLFATAEPAIQMVAGWVAYLPIADRRQQIDRLLMHAGDWLGLTANEFVAISIMSSAGMGFASVLVAGMTDTTDALILVGIILGAALPYMQLTSDRDERFKLCNRGLPGAIDLAALCMGAGLDFPGAIRQIVSKQGNTKNPLIEQFDFVLQELDLGRTRRQALENFAERVPIDSVQDFVNAVVQAEQKGNPLAEVLRIQAHMARMRRSVLAEEAAARAAVKMIGPLMLIFAAILLCLVGPFVIQAMSGGTM
jgi:tight adherence protein C